jgi:hypothetical protein
MLRVGLITLGLSVCLLVFFFVLSVLGVTGVGPCGPDLCGLILLLGFLLTGCAGALFIGIGVVKSAIDRFRQRMAGDINI